MSLVTDFSRIGAPLDPKNPEHAEAFAYLRPRGWSDPHIKAAALRWVSGPRVADLWPMTAKHGGEPSGGILLPYPNAPGYCAVRVFFRTEPEKGEAPKFLTPGGQAARVYVPAGAERDLADPAVPLLIIESPFKAAIAALKGLRAVVGVNGCDGAHALGAHLPVVGVTREAAIGYVRADIAPYLLRGRHVSFLTDADYVSNASVRRCNLALMDAAAVGFGCEAELIELPAGGVDDYLVEHSVKDFARLPHHARNSDHVTALRVALFDFTEVGLADRFELLHGGDVRHDPKLDIWFTYTKAAGWLRGAEEPQRRMEEIVRNLEAEAAIHHGTNDRSRSALMLQKRSHIDAALELAGRRAAVVTFASQFDANPDYLGVANGVLDLRSGRLIEPDKVRDCLVTKRARIAWDPKAKASEWRATVLESMGGDRAMAAFLQEIGGACLVGRPHRGELLLFVGDAFTGKSLVIETLMWVLGDYAVASKASLIFGRRHRDDDQERSTPFLMALVGRRLSTFSEVPEGVVLDDTLLKDLTGGDTITGRRNYGEAEQFKNTARLIGRCNELPMVVSTNDATWCRFVAVPFDRVVPEGERDKDLPQRLCEEESAGILAWMHEGLRRYAARGHRFELPRRVAEAVTAHRRKCDTVGEWLEDNVEVVNDSRVRTEQTAVTGNYVAWCKANNHMPLSSRRLWDVLRRRAAREIVQKIGGNKYAVGFRLTRGEYATFTRELGAAAPPAPAEQVGPKGPNFGTTVVPIRRRT